MIRVPVNVNTTDATTGATALDCYCPLMCPVCVPVPPGDEFHTNNNGSAAVKHNPRCAHSPDPQARGPQYMDGGVTDGAVYDNTS